MNYGCRYVISLIPQSGSGEGLLGSAGDTLLLLELAVEEHSEGELLDPCCCGNAQGSGDDRLCGPAGDRLLDSPDRSEDTTDELPAGPVVASMFIVTVVAG